MFSDQSNVHSLPQFAYRLGCWCKPEDCHGDVLVELVNQFCGDSAEPAELKNEAKFDLDFLSLQFKPNVVPETAACCQDNMKFMSLTATKKQKDTRALGEQKPMTDDVNSKRKKYRTPHLHTKNINTPKWHGSPRYPSAD